MPKTMPGFLLLAGVIMFVLSLIGGRIKAKDVSIPFIGNRSRWVLGSVGMLFIVYSLYIYATHTFLQPLARPVP